MSSDVTQVPPPPLGWCAWHLEDDEFAQAATLMNGTALCADCCKQQHASLNEMSAEFEARQQETFNRLSAFRPRLPGF